MRTNIIIWLSIQNLLWRKLRTLLTSAGIAIGIGTIVFLISLGNGLEKVVTDQVGSGNGLRNIVVVNDASENKTGALDPTTFDRIKNTKGVEAVEPEIISAGKITMGSFSSDIVINGVHANYFNLDNSSFLFGKPYKDATPDSLVLNEAAAKLLTDSNEQTLIGQSLSLNIPTYSATTIVSDTTSPETKTDSYVLTGIIVNDQPAQAYIPLSAFERYGNRPYNSSLVQLSSATANSDVRQKIEGLGLSTEYTGDTVDQIRHIFTIFNFLLGSLGLVTLLVSIIGIVNTLTVNLLEKTREVGFMKAMGVQEQDIRKIFMWEATLLSFIGGSLGVVMAMVLGFGLNGLVNIYAIRSGSPTVSFFRVSPLFILEVYLTIILIGIITGLYPSRRAAHLNPLDALRYE